jgi:phenylacetate-CoA ligase
MDETEKLMAFGFSFLRFFEDIIRRENVSTHMRRIRKLLYADPEFLHAYRLDLLQKLLHHAYENVPFYKKRFDDLGIQPQDIRSFEDFSRLPTLSRRDIREAGDDLISKTHKKKSLYENTSSGTTAQPIYFYHDKQARSAGLAATLVGWELAGKKIGDKVVTIWGNRKTVEEEWTRLGSRIKTFLLRDTRLAAFKLVSADKIEATLERMNKQKGGFVFGYGNALYSLALYASAHNFTFDKKFKGVITTAETIFPHTRKLIEEVMGPVYDCYGCQEIDGIAFQCTHRNGYHIAEPNVIFETREVAGDVREIIVTDLWNYAWPMIRYEIGDIARIGNTHCTCGCTWSTFESVQGRVLDLVPTSDGGYFYFASWLNSHILLKYPTIKQYQFAKIGPDKILLRFQVSEKIPDEELEKIRLYYDELLKGSLIELEITCVDRIEIGPSGKFRLFVDETTK